MRPRRRSSVLLLLGLTAMGVAVGAMVIRSRPAVPRITLTAGPLGTTRTLVAGMIVDAVAARGADARLVETAQTEEALEQVDRGMVDFALVSEAYRIKRRPHIREVAPLYVEALHLLVKDEMADAVSGSLGALRGRVVWVGPKGSTTADLAIAALGFAGIVGGDAAKGGGYVAKHGDVAELETMVARDPATLPDAIMYLATVPSKIAMQLIHVAGYRLVPLPFAEAFRLNALITDDTGGDIERQHVVDTVIPAYTYRTEPAVPAEPLHTLGTRLTLIANDAVSPETVELVLDTVFSSHVARATHPPLDHGVFALPPHIERHAGTIEYLRRDQPYITPDTVSALSSTFSVVGALAGGVLFLWQWWRQRTQASRDEIFGSYLLRIADLERRMATLELAATLELEPLVGLQREVLTLKSEALDRFTAGDLGSQAALSDLLGPLNAARDHIGDLILHVRDNLEEQAEAEGRTATAVWNDAIEKPDESGGTG